MLCFALSTLEMESVLVVSRTSSTCFLRAFALLVPSLFSLDSSVSFVETRSVMILVDSFHKLSNPFICSGLRRVGGLVMKRSVKELGCPFPLMREMRLKSSVSSSARPGIRTGMKPPFLEGQSSICLSRKFIVAVHRSFLFERRTCIWVLFLSPWGVSRFSIRMF